MRNSFEIFKKMIATCKSKLVLNLTMTCLFFVFNFTLKAQNVDTLKLDNTKLAIFFETKAEDFKFKPGYSNDLTQSKIHDYEIFKKKMVDSLEIYGIKYLTTNCRFIQFPFEKTNQTGFSQKYTLDREFWVIGDSSMIESMRFGVIWYGGRKDEIHWSMERPIRTCMKDYFFRVPASLKEKPKENWLTPPVQK